MIEDIRNSKNLSVYLEQLEEVKARLSFVSAYSNEEKDRFVIESCALQIRKLIELIAFSLIAIHRIRYEDYRDKAGPQCVPKDRHHGGSVLADFGGQFEP